MHSHAHVGTIVRVDKPITQPESPFEILRRLENLIRAGTISHVRHSKPPRCRVSTGGLTTQWVPWLSPRAGGNKGRQWWPPVVGEQCLLFSPGGDLLNAFALPGAFSDAMPQGSDLGNVYRIDWSGTDYMEHNATAGAFKLQASQRITLMVNTSIVDITPTSITLRAGGATLQIGPVKITSDVDVVAQGVSTVHHTHGGVSTGEDATGEPI